MSRSEVNYIYDAATALRVPASAAVITSGVIGTFTLDKLVNMRKSSQRNKLGAQEYSIVVVVSAIDRTTGDETYTFSVKTGAAGSPTTVVATLAVNKTGQHVICLDAHTIERLDATHAVLELSLAVAGTTPIISFSAWVGAC